MMSYLIITAKTHFILAILVLYVAIKLSIIVHQVIILYCLFVADD
jgi:hypothetical protein